MGSKLSYCYRLILDTQNTIPDIPIRGKYHGPQEHITDFGAFDSLFHKELVWEKGTVYKLANVIVAAGALPFQGDFLLPKHWASCPLILSRYC